MYRRPQGLIGRLQTNKAKYAVRLFDLIHSVDSLRLAEEIDAKIILGNTYHLYLRPGQQLIAEGLPQEEVLKLCDVHSAVLKGAIDRSSAREAVPGHPVHTFLQENRELKRTLSGKEWVPWVGRSPAMQQVGQLVEKVAASRSTVLIAGEIEKAIRRNRR